MDYRNTPRIPPIRSSVLVSVQLTNTEIDLLLEGLRVIFPPLLPKDRIDEEVSRKLDLIVHTSQILDDAAQALRKVTGGE